MAAPRTVVGDLHALVAATVRVVRGGGRAAVASLAVLVVPWVGLALLLSGALGLVVLLADARPVAPVFAAGLLAGLFIGVPLPFAGPLVAFGAAAGGASPTLREVLARVRARLRPLAVSYFVPWFLAATLASLLPHVQPPPWHSEAGTVALVAAAAAVVALYVRLFFATHVVVAVEAPASYALAWGRGQLLTRGRFPTFLVAATAPVAIWLSALPGRLGAEQLVALVGYRWAVLVSFIGMWVGFLVAVLAHSALAAAAYAVAVHPPEE